MHMSNYYQWVLVKSNSSLCRVLLVFTNCKSATAYCEALTKWPVGDVAILFTASAKFLVAR